MTGRSVVRERAGTDPAPVGRARIGDHGSGMLEVLMAMAVTMIVMAMGLQASGALLGVEADATGKGQATTEVVVAVHQLRQEIVSANVIFDPAKDLDGSANYAGSNPDGSRLLPGWSLRVYTQLNGVPMCVQWRLLDTGALQTRTWSDDWQIGGAVHPWSTLAGNVVNAAGAPPFALNYAANFGGASSRLVAVSLFASAGTRHVDPVLLQSSIAARDAEYFPPDTGVCFPIPTP